jgi:hypothetical protein
MLKDIVYVPVPHTFVYHGNIYLFIYLLDRTPKVIYFESEVVETFSWTRICCLSPPKLIYAKHLAGNYINSIDKCYKVFEAVLVQVSAGSGFERQARHSILQYNVSVGVWHLLLTKTCWKALVPTQHLILCNVMSTGSFLHRCWECRNIKLTTPLNLVSSFIMSG